jgi:hypothetical protein
MVLHTHTAENNKRQPKTGPADAPQPPPTSPSPTRPVPSSPTPAAISGPVSTKWRHSQDSISEAESYELEGVCPSKRCRRSLPLNMSSLRTCEPTNQKARTIQKSCIPGLPHRLPFPQPSLGQPAPNGGTRKTATLKLKSTSSKACALQNRREELFPLNKSSLRRTCANLKY